ncbi:MAG: hypothetical protein WCI67_06655 [Chloroflexales bacterium]
MPAGNRGGFNPYRDRRGRWAAADAAPAPAPATSGGGGAEINAAIRAAAGRTAEPTGPRSYHGYAPALATALRDFEDRTRHNPTESGAVFAPDGSVLVAEKSGTKKQVTFKKAETATFKGAIVTHNHPTYPGSGDTAFSGGDVSMAIQHGVSEIRAVVGRFNHVLQMRKPGTQEPAEVSTEVALFDVLYDDSQLAGRLMARKGKDPETVAWVEQSIHEQNLTWAKEYGYVYYRENMETGEVEGYGHDG